MIQTLHFLGLFCSHHPKERLEKQQLGDNKEIAET